MRLVNGNKRTSRLAPEDYPFILKRIRKECRIEFVEDIAKSSRHYIFHGVIRRDNPDEADRDVLVKIILSLDPEDIRRFEKESALYSRFHHDNLIRKEFSTQIQFGRRIGKCRCIVLEYLAGIDLKQLIDYLAVTKTEISVTTAINIGAKVLSALHEVHELVDEDGKKIGVVHADVSPHNILLSRKGQVKLIDFGIALTEDLTQETKARVIAGKISYMSPEQLAGETIDRRSDIFSFGKVFAETLAARSFTVATAKLSEVGNVPEQASTDVLYQLDIDPKLLAIIKRCLERKKDRRYQTSRAMILALDEYKNDKKLVSATDDISNLVQDVLAYYNQNTTVQQRVLAHDVSHQTISLDSHAKIHSPSPRPLLKKVAALAGVILALGAFTSLTRRSRNQKGMATFLTCQHYR